jgi:hypothetical protein
MAHRPFVAAIAISLLMASAWAGGAWAADTTAKNSPPPGTPTPPKLTAAERCASLEDQFEQALPQHLEAKKLASAKKLAEEGSERCAKKEYSLGSRRLVDALADLGVTAKL